MVRRKHVKNKNKIILELPNWTPTNPLFLRKVASIDTTRLKLFPFAVF
jgi:hypothetical protein